MSVALSFAAENRWTSHGPEGGVVMKIVTASGSTLYAATYGGGIFRSADNGESWSAINDGVSNHFVRSLAIDPVQSGTIYAATDGGLLRSVDSGASWTPTAALDDTPFDVIVDPTNHLVVYAAARNALSISTDGGEEWTDITNGVVVRGQTQIRALAVDRSQPGHLLCATETGLFSSVDRGQTWKPVLPFQTLQITAVAVDPANSKTICVTSQNYLFRSGDGGKTWNTLSGPSDVHQFLFAAPHDVYAVNSSGFWRSRDDGQTWRLTALAQRLSLQTVAVHPSNASTVFVGSDGQGVLRSTDSGATFRSQNRGLQAAYTRGVASDPANPALIYAATAGGIFKSVDRGELWQTANAESGAFSVTLDARNPNTVYAGSRQAIKTDDGGETWQGVRPNPFTVFGATKFTIDPSNSATIYASLSEGGFSKSTDSGQSWSYITNGLIYGFYYGFYNSEALAVDPTNSSTLFAASAGIVKSTNGGEKWVSMNTGLDKGNDYIAVPQAIAIDPSNSSIVYAGSWDGLFRTIDGGDHWTFVQIGTTDPSINDIVIDPLDSSIVYVATRQQGIFRSMDRGETWRSMNEGLTGGPALSLAIDSMGRSLTLGTAGGVFTMEMTSKLPPELHTSRLNDDAARLPGLLEQLRSLRAGAGESSSSSAFIIPAAGTIGRPGALRFRSDLLLANRAEKPQDVLIAWLAMGANGTDAPSFRLTLPAADSTAIPGFVDKLGFFGLGSVLVIAIDADGNFDWTASIEGLSQIWAAGPNNSSTLTELLTAVPIENLRNHRMATASDLRHDLEFRTNVGVVNLESEPRTFSIDLVGERQSVTISVNVEAFSMTHVSIPPGDYGFLTAVFQSAGADGLWTAYGSSVDNRSGEGRVVTAK